MDPDQQKKFIGMAVAGFVLAGIAYYSFGRTPKVAQAVKAAEETKQAVSKFGKWNRTKVDITSTMDWYQTPEGVPTVFDLMEKDSEGFFDLPITEKTQISPDTYIYKVGFPNPEWMMGLHTCEHMSFRVPAEANGGKTHGRPYSPVSPIAQRGSMDFVIKCYPKTEEFPNGGIMGQYIEKKEVGDTIRMRANLGRITYKGNYTWYKKKEDEYLVNKKKLGFIAGGSGITPIYRVIDALYRAKDTEVTVNLLFTNKTEDDMLLREELDAINADKSMPNFKVTHTLTRQ